MRLGVGQGEFNGTFLKILTTFILYLEECGTSLDMLGKNEMEKAPRELLKSNHYSSNSIILL